MTTFSFAFNHRFGQVYLAEFIDDGDVDEIPVFHLLSHDDFGTLMQSGFAVMDALSTWANKAAPEDPRDHGSNSV